MAMLAERKSKAKWCLNPRGKDWAQDSNKFGQKLLEKMGWKAGKGLGKQENGVTEHIKVSLKSDSKGLGFKEDANPWTETEEQFSQLLKILSETTDQPVPTKIQSLEKKSERSKSRLHYRKFTRGKDLTRYSAKDLANIFGKSAIEKVDTPEIKTVVALNVSSETPEIEPIKKKKMTGLDNPGLNLSVETPELEPSKKSKKKKPGLDSESIVTPVKKSKKKKTELDNPETLELEPSKKSKKKTTGFDNPGLNLSIESAEEEPIKKSKKKITGLDNPGLDLSIETPEFEPIKKSKKSKKGLDNPALNLSVETPELEPIKKSKKSKNGLDNPALNLSIETSELEPIQKSKRTKSGLDNPALNLSIETPELEPIKKSKKIKNGLDNPGLNLSIETTEPIKKSKKKITGLDNPALNLSIETPKLEPIKKSKKLKIGLDNPALNLSIETPEAISIEENVELNSEVSRKRKRGETADTDVKKKKSDYVNAALDLTDDKPRKHKKKPKSALWKPGGRRKSVQINESLNQEKFITDFESPTLDTSLQIENYQNELDNSINEKKLNLEPVKFKHLVLSELQNGTSSVIFPGVSIQSIPGYGSLS